MPLFIVKTRDGYLYPTDDCDVSWTAMESEAGQFDDVDWAHGTAEMLGYGRGSYEVIPVGPRIVVCQGKVASLTC